MLENEIYIMLRTELAAQMIARYGKPLGYKVRRQPQQEGRPSEPTVYIDKVQDLRYGWRKSSSAWDEPAGQQTLRELQPMETTLQLTFQQDASTDPAAATASDVCNMVASACQSERFIQAIKPYGAQVLRVGQVRNLPYKNDHDQWEFVPSFDLVIKHTMEYQDNVPVAVSFELNVSAVPDII